MRREAKGVVPDVRTDLAGGGHRGTGLVDVLDRVLDKGLLIAGDITDLAGRGRAPHDPDPL